MTIVDALIQKGSTGGNNIAEAIENLPAGGSGSGSSGGGIFYVNVTDTTLNDLGQGVEVTIDKTFNEVLDAYNSGSNVVIAVKMSDFGSGSPITYKYFPLNEVFVVSDTINSFTFDAISYYYDDSTSHKLKLARYYFHISSSSATGSKYLYNISYEQV